MTCPRRGTTEPTSEDHGYGKRVVYELRCEYGV